MAERRAALAAVLASWSLAVAGAGVPAAASGATPARDDGVEVAFRFADPAIDESSGLVVVRGLVATTNDSGDSGRVFLVDPESGRSVGTTRWAGEPVDVEALAPAGGRHVWVADIGDNRRARESVEVLRVPVGPGRRNVRPVRHVLELPGGSSDAEALLVHPVTGRLLVVTKGVLSGEVLEAPSPLSTDRPDRLRVVGRTTGIVTDGAFLPGGGAVVLRTYHRAVVYAYPSWQRLMDWELPDQEQGEALAVDGPDLLLSSEGARSAVLRAPIPPAALAAGWWDGPLGPVLRWLGVPAGA